MSTDAHPADRKLAEPEDENIPPEGEPAGPHPSAPGVLALMLIITVMLSLSSTAINIALPVVVDHFDASAAKANWILLSALLANTSLLVALGQIADRIRRRTMFMAGLVVFTFSSFLLGLAPNVEILIGLRVVQAIGAAALLCNAATIIVTVFPPARLGMALGVYMSGFAVAQIAGPPLGGIITVALDWRWLFWVNIPVGLVGLVWGRHSLRHLPHRPGSTGRFDLAGHIVILAGLVMLLTAVSAARNVGWVSPAVIGGIAAPVLFVPLLLLLRRHHPNPAVDTELFGDRVFAMAMLAVFFTMMPRTAITVILGLYYQGVEGDSPLVAGFKVLPAAAAFTIGSLLSDRLARLMGERLVMVASSVVTAVGVAIFYVAFTVERPFSLIVVAITVLGVSSGVFLPTNTTLIVKIVAAPRIGNVNGMRVMFQTTGVTIAIAVAVSLAGSGLGPAASAAFFAGASAALDAQDVGQVLEGYRLACGAMFAMSVAGIMACLLCLRDRPRGRV